MSPERLQTKERFNIATGVLCPGPHLPHHYPILIGLFILCRLYIILLPGILLSRVGMAWLKKRQNINCKR